MKLCQNPNCRAEITTNAYKYCSPACYPSSYQRKGSKYQGVTCSVADCNEPARVKGMCQSDYQKSRPNYRPEPQYCVYRVFDKQNVLLYVGHSKTIEMRIDRHCYQTEWWSEAYEITIDLNFDTKEQMLAAERQAIHDENPKYNKNRSNIGTHKVGNGLHNRDKTHCIHGHEFTEENTRIRIVRGVVVGRACRACNRKGGRN